MSALGTATVKANSGLNVRAKATANSERLGGLANGAKVQYYSDSNGWLKINYNNRTGYICKQYTNVTKGATASGGNTTSGGSAASGKVRITASSLRVRKSNSTSSGILGNLPNGTVVSYTGENNGWLKIQYQGQTGWISKQYTTPAGGANVAQAPVATKPSGGTTKYVTASTLNVRKGPGTSYEAIGSLSNGAQVTVYSSSNGWSKIAHASGTAYVSSQYLSSSKQSSDSGSTYVGNGKLNPRTRNYKQSSNPWGPKMYSSCNNRSQTYSNSACGPTACASIIGMRHRDVNPETLGTWAVANGHRTRNNGTTHAFVSKVGELYGFSVTQTSVDEGCRQLANGKYAVAAMGPGYWTSFGHFITPYGYADGTIYVDDPASTKRHTQGKSQFKKECNGFWVYS